MMEIQQQGIILKDIRKATRACDECKRRKGRCFGSSPCNWCSTNNLECVFSSAIQKRGPKKKKRKGNEIEVPPQLTLVLDKRELDLFNDMELGNYLEMYLKYVDPLYTMLGQWDRGSRLVHLVQPRTPTQFIIKYAACAIIARLTGHRERSNSLIAEARSLSGKAFDDISADGLVGFMLLGSFWTGGDSRINYHYYSIALSMFNLLAPTEIPPNIRHLMTVCSVLSSEAMDGNDKLNTYLARSKAIENQNYTQGLVAAITRLRVKVFSHVKCCEAETLRMDVVAALACKVIYSEPQRKMLLADLESCRQVAKMCQDINSDKSLSTSVSILLNVFEVLIEWRSGHVELALPIAIKLATECTFENIRYGTPSRQRFDVEQLLMVSIFLYESQQPTLATKLQNLAETYALILCDSFPPLNTEITDSIVKYIRARPFSTSHSSSSSSTSTSVSSSTNTMLDDMMPTMINNVISLISQLLPINIRKFLLPAQGLHMFYKTLSTFLPPINSPLDFNNDDKPFSPIIICSNPLLTSSSCINDNNNNTNNFYPNVTNNSNNCNNNNNNINSNITYTFHNTNNESAFSTFIETNTKSPTDFPSPSSSPPQSVSPSPPQSLSPSSSFSIYTPAPSYEYPDAVISTKSHPFNFLENSSPPDSSADFCSSFAQPLPASVLSLSGEIEKINCNNNGPKDVSFIPPIDDSLQFVNEHNPFNELSWLDNCNYTLDPTHK